MSIKIKTSIYLLILILLTQVSCDIKEEGDKTKIYSEEFYNVFVIKKDEMNFGVSLSKPEDADFYVNSNFFNKEDKPIGLVVINRLRHSVRKSGGGYFYVLNNRPFVSSLYCPTMTDFASQSLLWAINDGVKNEDLFHKKHAKKNVYRTLLGLNSKRDIIVVSSNRVGFVSIKEIVEYAEKIGVIEGILLDGGSSVDYKFTTSDDEISFQSLPNYLKKSLKISQPTTYIYGNYKS